MNGWERITGMPFVGRLIRVGQTDSTNEYAKLPGQCPSAGLQVIVADRQTAGRGQRGNRFFSSVDGGLWCTLVVPAPDIGRHFACNRAVSLAIARSLESRAGLADVRLKWPNDVFAGGRKICGILLEAQPPRPCLIVGFGINVNIAAGLFPEDLRPIATSVLIETGRNADISGLLADVLEEFERLRHTDEAPIHDAYVGRLMGLGARVVVEDHEGVFESVLVDGRACIRERGALVTVTSGPMRIVA